MFNSRMTLILLMLELNFQLNGQLQKVWLTINSVRSQMYGHLVYFYGKLQPTECHRIQALI